MDEADTATSQRTTMDEADTVIVGQPEIKPVTLATVGLWMVRYGIGIVMLLAGGVVLLLDPSGSGADGFSLAVGGGLSVLLLNFLYRLGVSGDQERAKEEEAWHYFEEHGEWPDDPPAQRTWTVPAGSVVYKDEHVKSA